MNVKLPFGNLPSKERDLIIQLLSKLLVKDQVVDVWPFGSRTKLTNQEFSDIDVLLESTGSVDFSSEQLNVLSDALEESDSPYKFDIVNYKNVLDDHRESVDREKIILAKGVIQ